MSTWYVRPNTSHGSTRNGTSYATAWGGWSEIVWGSGGVVGGDTLYVCGAHSYTANIAPGNHGGTSGSRCVIRGDGVDEAGSIAFVGAYYVNLVRSYTTIRNLAFTGGADEESDADLRQRYILVATEYGRATVPTMKEWLEAIDDDGTLVVREAKVYNKGAGDIEVIADITATEDNIDLVIEALGSLGRGPEDTGRADPIAKQWADLFTKHYPDLAAKDSTMAQLRNLMDLCVVSAVIKREDLVSLAGGPGFPLLTNSDSKFAVGQLPAPKTVEPQCSFLKIGRNYVITASGGVELDSWAVAAKSEVDPQVKQTHTKAGTPARSSWWWN